MEHAKKRMPAAASSMAALSASQPADRLGHAAAAPVQPCNTALQHEAAAFLAEGRAAEAAAAIVAASQKSVQRSTGVDGRGTATGTSLADLDGSGDRVAYPHTFPATDGINPCTCTGVVFDEWLRAVVVSIPGPMDAVQKPSSAAAHSNSRSGGGGGVTISTVDGGAAATALQKRGRDAAAGAAAGAAVVAVVSREHALYAALELLEAAARLLQRRLAQSRGQTRLLTAYYNALEEDIDSVPQDDADPYSSAPAAVAGQELKSTAFHRRLRARKRAVPLSHYSGEQSEMEGRLEKVYYVLRKLEEIEGLSNSILVEGREAAAHGAAPGDAARASKANGAASSDDDVTDSDYGSSVGDTDLAGDDDDGDAAAQLRGAAGVSARRLMAVERRVRRMRRQLRLPLQPAQITSRLRNELILSFSARVLALREPAPFTSDTHAGPHSSRSAHAATHASSSSSVLQDRHRHSISAFVEWYVQHVMDPPAMSQLLSIVPHEYVVTTSCRLVYACEAHASLRASRALPDLGAVLLRAVSEGRADAVAQLVLSSSVSYGSALAHDVDSPTCFFAGLMTGQLDVVARLVAQQCWEAEALHVLLFAGAPWSRASAARGCYAYQRAMLDRVWRVLALVEKALRKEEGALATRSRARAFDTPFGNAEEWQSEESDADTASSRADEREKSASSSANVAMAALRDARLLTTDSAAEGLSLLQMLHTFLTSTPQLPPHAAPRRSITAYDSSTAAAAAAAAAAAHNSGSINSALAANGSFFDCASSPFHPPAFLDGGLQRLRLLLAARNATLQCERHQQDAQWEALLKPAAAATAATEKSGPPAKEKALLASGATPSATDAVAVDSASLSTFATVLRHEQLDALSPASVCPLQCLVCPAYSTPMLQRVDGLSYGPLQPTITTTAPGAAAASAAATTTPVALAAGTAETDAERLMVSSDDDNNESTAARDAGEDVGAEPNSSADDNARTVRALLMRADTAIEPHATVWRGYCFRPAPLSDGAATRRTPWRRLPCRWLTDVAPRYSATVAVEERISAAVTAKQQRSRAALYGASPSSQRKDGEDAADGAQAGSGPRPSPPLPAGTRTLPQRHAALPATRSTYFEVHLSLSFLLALHDSTAASAPAARNAAGQPSLANSVVVGLCDAETAATANGCTRGPHQPHPVTHLGYYTLADGSPHSSATAAMTTTQGRSAGVSVSVIARVPKAADGDSVSDQSGVAVEEVYLALWHHRRNSTVPVMGEGDAPVYLRLDVPVLTALSAQQQQRKKKMDDDDDDHGAEEEEEGEDEDDATPAPLPQGHHHSGSETGGASQHVDGHTVWVPTATVAAQEDVKAAVAQRSAALPPAADPSSSTSVVAAATVVLGLLYTPASDSLRVRVNGYEHPAELAMGLAAPTALSPDGQQRPQDGPTRRLFPAATLSLDEHGWGRWYTHQTEVWSRARHLHSGAVAAAADAAPSSLAGRRPGGDGGSGAAPYAHAVSNAVVRFAFEAEQLCYGPPLPPAVKALKPAVTRLPARPGQTREHVVELLDTTAKFQQLLQVLTDVTALAGMSTAQWLPRKEVDAPDGAPPGLGEGGSGRHAKAGSAAAAAASSSSTATPFFGSRDRRLRDALARAQQLLNTPAAEGVLFYPPVRIYRHSSHCPQQDLYPLPAAPATAAEQASNQGEERSASQQSAAGKRRSGPPAAASGGSSSSPPLRRQLGTAAAASAAMGTSGGAPLYWHELISENTRLTPLCAALASRQPTLAYVICTHPLTSFTCSGGDATQQRVQMQQRRTALYAACALGYVDVVAVLLERIPIEEFLFYFGLVIEGEARTALQQSYARAENLFLRNYRLSLLSADTSAATTPAAAVTPAAAPHDPARDAAGGVTAARETAVPAYATNACQRPLLDVASIYSTTRSLYTPLHVALLGVIQEEGEEGGMDSEDASESDDDDNDSGEGTPAGALPHIRGLSRQTGCATLLLNCLYDLLLVVGATTLTKRSSRRVLLPPSSSSSNGNAAGDGPHHSHSSGAEGAAAAAESTSRPASPAGLKAPSKAGSELLASALNLQSRGGETALLLAVRHNNCTIATRLLRLGAQAACMDRVTHLFTLELACANRCSPMAEALLQAPSSPFATSPVLLNHAGIATALCWCAINNMHTVLQQLLLCDGVDVSTGFEGSSPLHLAITFGSEEAALALLRGTQPKMIAGTSAAQRHAAQRARQEEKSQQPGQRQKPFMDVNVLHDRTHCTPLHLACERGQLQVIRTLLVNWHAQLNTAAAHTNYTPLLTALASGREDAALRVLEYSKDELRRGRAVLDLTAIDQSGDTALHLAARRGLVLAMEYMLVQFCEEEVGRLAQLHPSLLNSPAFMSATCIVPLHALNKQGKSALLVAIQYDQAEAAEVLASTLMDNHDLDEAGMGEGEAVSPEPTRSSTVTTAVHERGVVAALYGGPLVDGTCMALHQAFKRRLYTVLDLMMSTPSSAYFFPCSAAFRATVQRHIEERRGGRPRTAQIVSEDTADGAAMAASASRAAAPQNRSSFVRLLLTRAAGPTVSPDGALHLLFGGFVLPELCVYLSGVAAESAVLGVQHGTAMAYAELIMGYLQEHAGLVVAPTRMVAFCRDVWGCLQRWMTSKAALCQQQHRHYYQQLARRRRHGTPGTGPLRLHHSGWASGVDVTAIRVNGASPQQSPEQNAEAIEVEAGEDGDSLEPPMVWLCRVLLLCASAVPGARPRMPVAAAASPSGAAAPPARTEAERQRDSAREEEGRHVGESMRSALNRKSLSLDVARAIRLHGSSAGGARAIEEIEGLVRAFVTTKANARARQLRKRATDGAAAAAAAAAEAAPQPDAEAAPAAADAAESSAMESSMTSAAAVMALSEADVYQEVIGNEELFTTPLGFTVLQLATALGLTEVTAFLVETYKLDPLYAPAQELYAEAEADAAVRGGVAGQDQHPLAVASGSPGARSSVVASASSAQFAALNAAVAAAATATSAREQEDANVRVLNTYTVRAMAQLNPMVAWAAGGRGAGEASSLSSSPASSATFSSFPAHGHAGSEGSAGADADASPASGAGGDAAGAAWFYWTPYRLAVQTGNVTVVRTLLRAGAQAPVVPMAGKKSAARLDRLRQRESQMHLRNGGHALPSSSSASANRIVDFKEPQWVDPYQRTALQERIVAMASASPPAAASGSSSSSSSQRSQEQPRSRLSSELGHRESCGTGESDLAAEMIPLLLQHGAQPNGLFDSTGSDAWMLALMGGAAAGGGAARGAEGGHGAEAGGHAAAANSAGSCVGRCLSLLLRCRTPLLGHAPDVGPASHQRNTRSASRGEAAAQSGDAGLDEQLLRQSRTLLRQWRRLVSARDTATTTSSNSAAREKVERVRRQRAASAAAAMAGLDGTDENGFVFEAAEALSEGYGGGGATAGSESNVTSLRASSPRPAETLVDDDVNSKSSNNNSTMSVGPLVFPAAKEEAPHSPSLVYEASYLSPPAPLGSRPQQCREELRRLLRLCYRVALLYLCIDHAPHQLMRLLHAYSLDLIPLRARHPLNGDTVITRLLRQARERLLTAGSTPTETELDDMMSRVIDGGSAPEVGDGAEASASASAEASASAGQRAVSAINARQRVYRDPTEDAGAAALLRLSLALIHTVPRLCNVAEAAECAMLQCLLFQPSFDAETALSIAARLAYVPLISAMVQSAASPVMLEALESGKVEWSSKRSSRYSSRRVSRAPPSATLADAAEVPYAFSLSDAAAPSTAASFSLFTNLTDLAVRVLLGTRVYYPAHEIITVRILLHCMPDETTRLAFLRWVYPNIHPLPALQLAMDNVDVAAYFLTSPDCMNALWTNLLYAHFTRQLDTAVRASAKTWNALLKVVLPGAPAVPIYLVLRGSLQTRAEEGDTKTTGLETRTLSIASLRSTTSTVKRVNSHRQKKVELTNWSYLVRRTTIFLQLMSMAVAETLVSKPPPPVSSSTAATAAGAAATTTTAAGVAAAPVQGGAPSALATQRGTGRAVVRSPSAERADVVTMERASGVPSQGAAGATTATTTPSGGVSRGLKGTLLLDTLELAVRYDDKEVLSVLMQLQLPDVVIKYIQQLQQQQQAATLSSYPVSMAVQNANTRALETAAATIAASYPSFIGVRSMTQASIVLDRLQRLLWREAVLDRHLDLTAVLAGAVRTLQWLYASRQAEVGSLMSPLRYDRIDMLTGNPEGVSTAPPPSLFSPSQLTPGEVTSRSMVEEAVVTPVEPQPSHRAERRREKHFPDASQPVEAISTAAGVRGKGDRDDDASAFPAAPFTVTTAPPTRPATADPTATLPQSPPPPPPQSPLMQSPRSAAQEESRFAESCLLNGRLAGREERRRRVTAVTWGIGSAALAIELPSGQHGVLGQGDDSSAAMAVVSGGGAALPPPLPPAPVKASAGTLVRTTPPSKQGGAAKTGTEVAKAAVQIPPLQLPVESDTVSTPADKKPVFFMYLQLDWVMFFTCLLRSPQPSTATVDTLLYLLEHRCALSVPALDLFLSGLTVPASADVYHDASTAAFAGLDGGPGGSVKRTHGSGYASQMGGGASAAAEAGEAAAQLCTVELSLRYQTRRHRDTLLHILVLHDQCQLAEYYLEYCYFYFVSQHLDPEPKNGRPGRFPIHEVRKGGRDTLRKHGEEAMTLANTPVEFLRLMLRVNAHGLTAFDYAHSPAMLRLLEWYGCVPPTYRPNPRLFRQVLLHGTGVEETGQEAGDGVTGWFFNDDSTDINNNNTSTLDTSEYKQNSGSSGLAAVGATGALQPVKKKWEPMYFFPAPRLVLASDNFVTLLDPTNTELAALASNAPPNLRASPSSSVTALARLGSAAGNGETGKAGEALTAKQALQDQLGDRKQLMASRQLAALMANEKRQYQLAQRRREQQERAKALLYEHVAVQPLLMSYNGAKGEKLLGAKASISAGGDGLVAVTSTAATTAAAGAAAPSSANSAKNAGARRRGPANPPYLTKAVTTAMRERWEQQRHPPISENVLWHNALEAQRQSASASAFATARARQGGGVKSSSAAAAGGRAGREEVRRGGAGGLLPILLSEEVSLLHLGLCDFDDELVGLYGELRAAPLRAYNKNGVFGNDGAGDSEGGGGHGEHARGGGGAAAQLKGQSPAQPPLSAYSKMLLPPVLAGKAGAAQQQQKDGEAATTAEAAKHKSNTPDASTSPFTTTGSTTTASIPATASVTALGQRGRVSTTSVAGTPPPRLSHADVIFLLECQQFIVFPLALPSVAEESEEASLGKDRRRSTRGSLGSVLGGLTPEQRGGGAEATGPLSTNAVIDRCTGLGGAVNNAGGRAASSAGRRAASTITTANGSAALRSSATSFSGQPARLRSRVEAAQPPTDVPLLRVLLSRQAAVLSDLVDATTRRYDTALLVSLTPMQLSGAAGGVAARGREAAGGGAVTMRALAEKLAGTAFKQFGSQIVMTPAAASATTPATAETVALLHVPPFSAMEVPMQPHHQPQQQQQRSTHQTQEDAAGGLESAATNFVAASHVPTIMAARMEEWVARRWAPASASSPPSRKGPAKLARTKSIAHEHGGRVKAAPTPLPAAKLLSLTAAEDEEDNGPPPLALDRVAPVGGVATATQQSLMRALLKHFSSATGAQLSEQMGLVIAPNYDVEEVGDAAAALRSMAPKEATPPQKKKR